MIIKVYPKINMCLKVFKEKTNSKHYIDSIFYIYKKIHDSIYIKKSKTLSILYLNNRKPMNVSGCLVTKSLMYLNERYNIDVAYKIIIKKRIPFGAGLGGGSADAAAVINYVLSKNSPISLDLKDIALKISSDLPFFLTKFKVARVQQFGNVVNQVYDWRPKFKVKRNRYFSSTQKVFELLEKDDNYVSRVNVDNFIKSRLYNIPLGNIVYNDLTKYIIQNNKELLEIYKKYGSNCFFTGAGSALVILKGKRLWKLEQDMRHLQQDIFM